MAWERQATNKLPNDFDIQNAHACRSQVQKWQAGVAGATRVRAGRIMRDGAVFYAYCTSHQQCSFVWRHEFSTAEAGGKEHEVCSKGIHAEEPRKVRGTAVDVREQANALTQSNTPMQATVRLVEKGVDVEEWPSKADLTKARRRTTRQPDRGAEAGGGTTLGQWLEHLKEIDDAETPWQTIARADGCGVVMCQKFAEVAADLIAQAQGEAGSGHYLVGAHDCTYKVFSSDWGLWKFCLACKRYDEEGLPRTSLATIALGYVPKEGEEQMVTVLHLLKEWHEQRGNKLGEMLHQVHADESQAGQNALRRVFPGTVFILDVRHQLATIVRRGGASKETKSMVAANLQFAFSALGFSQPLFHLYIDSLLQRLVELGELDFVQYLQTEVVEKRKVGLEEMWTSPCRCHVSVLGTPPKFQSQDSLEASWQHLKNKLPINVAKLPSTSALDRVLQATEVNSHGPYKLKVCGLSQRLVSGAAVFTERIGVLEEKQLRLPCAKMLWQHCPSNTKTFEFKPGELPEVLSAFVVPLSQAGMVIDHEVASCMISLVRLCESSVAQVPCARYKS
ncbi:Dynein heavy chain 8 [Durusdinium trenchii]|uniref:Axonemal n=1 Tax=Durusdinium trenchii TaxID=1381693 RepID=A0ABP0JMG4_9DINO